MIISIYKINNEIIEYNLTSCNIIIEERMTARTGNINDCDKVLACRKSVFAFAMFLFCIFLCCISNNFRPTGDDRP